MDHERRAGGSDHEHEPGNDQQLRERLARVDDEGHGADERERNGDHAAGPGRGRDA